MVLVSADWQMRMRIRASRREKLEEDMLFSMREREKKTDFTGF